MLGDDALDELLDLGVVAHEATLRDTDEPLEGADLVGSNVDTLTLESTLTLDQSDSCCRLTGMLGNSYLAREAFIVHRGIEGIAEVNSTPEAVVCALSERRSLPVATRSVPRGLFLLEDFQPDSLRGFHGWSKKALRLKFSWNSAVSPTRISSRISS